MERGPQTDPIHPENGAVPPTEISEQKKTLTEALHEQLGVKIQQEPGVSEIPQNPQVPQTPKIEKISFVDVTQLAESEARDVAEENLTARKENLKGIKGWWKKVWDHNILREYNRQKEIAKVKGEIYKDKNIYAGVDDDDKNHKAAMAAITSRFLSEYDVVREEADEARKNLDELNGAEAAEKEVLKDEIKKMIMDYATAEHPSDAAFEEARYRVLEKVTKLGKGVVEEGKMYADNLRTVAEQVRMSLAHNKGLQQLDFELDITLGRATSGVRTEANYNRVDKIIEKVHKSKVGSLLVNETAVASAVAIAASVAPRIVTGITRNAAKAAGFFGGMGVTALVAGAKENRRLKLERAQHARGMAKGGKIEKNSDRRQQMEEYRYETESATDLKKDLLSQLYTEGNPEKGALVLEPAQFEDALRTVSQIEGRINLSNKKGIDLISYSDTTKVEIERTNLEIELARAKVALKKMLESNPALQGDTKGSDFDEMLKEQSGAYEKQTTDSELKKKDRQFNKMKAKKVAYAAARGAVNSVVVGGVIQEATSWLNPNVEGLTEHIIKGHSHTALHNTPLEQLRGYVFGNPHEAATDAKLVNVAGWHDAHEHIQFPEGTKVIEGPNHDTITVIDPSGKTVAENIPFKFNGTDLTDETRKALEEHHIAFISAESHTIDGGTTSIETSPDDYAQNHPGDLHTIKRDLWYDNDTAKPVFDKNELGTHWGGVNGTGINEEGKYVFNIAHMSKDGSYHGEFSADAKELMKNGGLKMLFSMSQDTQHQVFEVPIDANGNAIIDPDSEVGKLLFKTVDGKAEFTGRFAEVGQVMPGDDAEHFRILSTVEGDGIDKIPDTAPTTELDTIRRFTFETEAPRDWDLPPAIPVMGRTPLEPLGREKPKEEPKPQPRPIKQEVPTAPVVETPVEVLVVEPQKESPVVEYEEMHAEEEKVQKGGEEIPKGSFRPERSPETKAISQEEYDALRDDINLINKKVQANEGIITVDENSFKSEYAKRRYNELKNIQPGIPVQFNKTELRTMGDEIEGLLMKSKVDRSLDKLMLTQEEYEDLVDDIKFINKKVQANEGIITVNEGDFFSVFGKRKYDEMKNIKPGVPVQFNKTELREMGDMIERRILANSKVAKTARDIELMRSQRGISLDQVPVRQETAVQQPQQPATPEPIIITPEPEVQPQTIETQNPATIVEEEPNGEEEENETNTEENEEELPTPQVVEQTEKKDLGMVYQEYAKKFTVNENFIGVANAKETSNPKEAILTFDPATKRVLPYREGWEELLRSTKGDPFFLERALRPFFNYDLKGKDFGTHFEKLRFTPAEIDPSTGTVVKKGEIKVVDDGSPLIKIPVNNIAGTQETPKKPEELKKPEEPKPIESPVENKNEASIPLLITREMEQQLADLGWTKEMRNKLTPQQAQVLIKDQIGPIKP